MEGNMPTNMKGVVEILANTSIKCEVTVNMELNENI